MYISEKEKYIRAESFVHFLCSKNSLKLDTLGRNNIFDLIELKE